MLSRFCSAFVLATLLLGVRSDRQYAKNAVHYILLNEPFLDTELSALEDIVIRDLGVGSQNGVAGSHITFLDTYLRRQVHGNHWSLVPLLNEALKGSGSNVDWFFLGNAYTRINLDSLGDMLLRRKDERLLGVRLQDNFRKPSILHHFNTNSDLAFPLVSSGCLFHRSLVVQIVEAIERTRPKANQTIDALHELMVFIYKETGVTLRDAPEMCVLPEDSQYIPHQTGEEVNLVCATWTDLRLNVARMLPRYIDHQRTPWRRPEADPTGVEYLKSLPFDSQADVVIAVKTAVKHLEGRVTLQHEMWASQQSLPSGQRLIRFAENSTHTIAPSGKPIVLIDVEGGNQEYGHCGKFFGILKYLDKYFPSTKFFVIIDDDTALNVRGLYDAIASTYLIDQREAAERFNLTETLYGVGEMRNQTVRNVPPSREESPKFHYRVSPLYMGDRYGYGQIADLATKTTTSYSYISGGGGIVLDREAVRIIMECETCRCLRPEEPDDMALGRWFKRLGIDAAHHVGFHQAHPLDYHPVYLSVNHGLRASFHRLKRVEDYFTYLEEKRMQDGHSGRFPTTHPFGAGIQKLTGSRYFLEHKHDEL